MWGSSVCVGAPASKHHGWLSGGGGLLFRPAFTRRGRHIILCNICLTLTFCRPRYLTALLRLLSSR